MQKSKTGIQIISLLTALFIPALLGWLLFHYHEYFQSQTTNHGVLLKPPVQEPALAQEIVKRQWQIVFAPAACDSSTDKTMLLLNQIKRALGKNQHRVSLTLLADPTCQQDPHDFRKLSLSKEQYAQLANSLLQGDKNFTVNNKIYLLDPIGNLFMYYSGETDPMNILKDLQLVLEVSQID